MLTGGYSFPNSSTSRKISSRFDYNSWCDSARTGPGINSLACDHARPVMAVFCCSHSCNLFASRDCSDFISVSSSALRRWSPAA